MFEPYGLVGGLSVGIPAVQVIDENGNIISNVATTGNVSANIVTANAFKFANGANFTTQAAGTNTQVQFNDNNNFAGDANFTFDSTQALLTVSNLNITGLTSLGDVSNVTILGGNNGYFLQTDGAGVLTWAPASGGGGGNGTPGGANTQVQYNKSGEFGGDAGFTYNDSTNTLHANYITAVTFTGNLSGNATRAGTVTTPAQPNITSVGTLANLNVSGNISGANANLGNTVVANYFVGNLYGSANTALVVTSSSQPNITSVGNLVELTVSGELFANDATLGNSVVANYFVGNLYGSANTAGTVTTNAQPNITSVGQLTNLVVTGDVTATNFVGNVSGNATTAGTVTTSSQPNITSVGTLTGLTVNGNISAGNSVTSNYFLGRLYGAANTASTVTTNAQPNITSVGTLVSLGVAGNVTAENANLGNTVVANFFVGDGGLLSNLQISNASVSNANYASYAGNITIAGQSNITTVGNLTNLTVVGNSALGNVATANLFVGNVHGYSNRVTDNAQPNITSVGTLVDLGVTGNVTAGNVQGGNLVSANYLSGTLTTAAQANITTVGTLNGLLVNGNLVASNITANTGVVSGNGSGLHHLNGANVTGTVANANYAVWGNYSAFAGFVTNNAQPNISSVGPLVTLEVDGNIYVNTNSFLGNIAYANYFVGNGNGLSNINGSNVTQVGNANYATYAGTANLANYVVVNAQPNITSVGNLTTLTVTGNANFSGNLRSTGYLRAVGNVNFGGSPNIYLGDVANLHIAGGFANYILTTNGAGNLIWTSGGSIGLSPGGPNTAVQYNANGVFGGSSALEFDTDSNTLTLAGNFVSNALQMGVGANAFYTSTVFSAVTASIVPNQVLWSVPVANISGVEFVIIATDDTNSSRQTCKIFASCYGSTVAYNEYAGLVINNGVGSFDVDYDSGTASLQLLVTPNNIDMAVYKILITQYAP